MAICGNEKRPGCGKQIQWATLTADDGKVINIPLDPSAPVYEITGGQDDKLVVKRTHTAMVNHFKTCPVANKFSKGSKKK